MQPSFDHNPFELHNLMLTFGWLAIGLCLGSFLNVVIARLPVMLEIADSAEADAAPFNLAVPRSRCPRCGHVLSWWENMPLVGFCLLGGRCRACRVQISYRYPLIELAGAAAAGTSLWAFGPSLAGVGATVFLLGLVTVSVIDLDHRILPDIIVLPMLWAGLCVAAWATPAFAASAILGAAAGYVFLWLIAVAYGALRRVEAMGAGDFKLAAMIGAWLGLGALPIVFAVGFGAGAIVGCFLLIVRGCRPADAMPFGPLLALGAATALFFGDHLTSAWFAIAAL